MTSVSEISLVAVPPPVEDDDALGPNIGELKSIEVPQPRPPSPLPLVVLAIVAGTAAMFVGGMAVVSAAWSDDATPSVVPAPAEPAPTEPAPTPRVEERILALLAKPSTDRVIFRGTGGRLVLAVGSAGRSAILVRGLGRAPASRPYHAWVVRAGKSPVRAATFTGVERAVFLSVPVARKDSIVVASERADALRPKNARVIAVLG